MVKALKTVFLWSIILFQVMALAQGQVSGDQSSRPVLPKKLQHIVYAGADGSRCEQAVIIKNAANTQEGVVAEKAWINWKYPTAKIKQQALSGKGDKYFDVFTIETAEGEKKTVCFDITDFFGSW